MGALARTPADHSFSRPTDLMKNLPRARVILVQAFLLFVILGGVLQGTGQVIGPVANVGGIVSPGLPNSPIGTIEVFGNYTQFQNEISLSKKCVRQRFVRFETST